MLALSVNCQQLGDNVACYGQVSGKYCGAIGAIVERQMFFCFLKARAINISLLEDSPSCQRRDSGNAATD